MPAIRSDGGGFLMLHCLDCDYYKNLTVEHTSPRNPFLCDLLKMKLDAELVRYSSEPPCSGATMRAQQKMKPLGI